MAGNFKSNQIRFIRDTAYMRNRSTITVTFGGGSESMEQSSMSHCDSLTLNSGEFKRLLKTFLFGEAAATFYFNALRIN